jgi:transposase
MTIVMGLDQHRAQITAEWLDTETGEVMRSRISPAHRAGVRRFSERFRGQELEVALEATTSWRFVAVALVRFGEVATIALEECDRAAAGAGPRNGPIGLGGCWFAGRIQRSQPGVDVDAASP